MPRALLVLLVAAVHVVADGGTVVLRKQAGPLLITVFSSSAQLRMGRNDVSVMVEDTVTKSAIQDANVTIHLRQSSPSGISEVYAPATHEKATNKLLYATLVDFSTTGVWRLIVNVNSKTDSAEVAGDVNVLPPQPSIVKYWPYFVIVPILIGLYLLNQFLRKKQNAARRPARP